MSEMHETGREISKPSVGFCVVLLYVYFRVYKTYELANKLLPCTVAQMILIITLSCMCCLQWALYVGQYQSTVRLVICVIDFTCCFDVKELCVVSVVYDKCINSALPYKTPL